MSTHGEQQQVMINDDDDDWMVRETLELIGKKWHPVIIQTLLDESPLRYSELQSRVEGISAKVLTESLEDLVENGLVRRQVVSEGPRRVEYRLTAHGREMESVFDELLRWGERNLSETPYRTVLVVDDDPRLARMHAGWLAPEYDVRRATSGVDALREVDDDVDIVLLDRRMVDLDGATVLARIRDNGIDCPVVMLSAVEPDFDIVAMPFDAYLTKPVVKRELRETVAAVLDPAADEDGATAETDSTDALRQYLALNAKRSLLLTRMTEAELGRSDEYRRLLERLELLETSFEADAVPDVAPRTVETYMNGCS